MTSSILSLAQGIPSYSLPQNEIGDRLATAMGLDDEMAWMLEKLYRHSGIGRRYSVLPDILPPLRSIGMSERNILYKKEAPPLALKAASKAILEWGQSNDAITHVISISCTGAITPGIEHFLVRELGLQSSVSLLGINFMGCHGAFKGLKVASKIAQANPRHRILMVCTELCTLHIKPQNHLESMVIQSLFGDGAAAAIIGSHPTPHETALFEIHQECSRLIPETEKEMTWDASDEGFEMTLTPRIPALITEHITSFAEELMDRSPQEYTWAVHPGGKAILEAVENGLHLDRFQLSSSWTTLENYGNISSATFLYVLHELSKRQLQHQDIVGLGFGPGLTVEGLLLSQKSVKEE